MRKPLIMARMTPTIYVKRKSLCRTAERGSKPRPRLTLRLAGADIVPAADEVAAAALPVADAEEDMRAVLKRSSES